MINIIYITRNEKARKKIVHKKSQHFKARNLGNTSSSESFSYMNINPKVNKFTIHINVDADLFQVDFTFSIHIYDMNINHRYKILFK